MSSTNCAVSRPPAGSFVCPIMLLFTCRYPVNLHERVVLLKGVSGLRRLGSRSGEKLGSPGRSQVGGRWKTTAAIVWTGSFKVTVGHNSRGVEEPEDDQVLRERLEMMVWPQQIITIRALCPEEPGAGTSSDTGPSQSSGGGTQLDFMVSSQMCNLRSKSLS